MNSPSPYQIEQAMSALMSARARLIENDPDLASDEAAIAELLGSEQADAMGILHQMLRASVHAKDMAEAADARAHDITERRDRYRRRADALRGAAFAAMDALGARRVELPDLTASISAGQSSVVVVDETVIPERFVRIKRETDKASLLAALKAGERITGAELSNGLPKLTVRAR